MSDAKAVYQNAEKILKVASMVHKIVKVQTQHSIAQPQQHFLGAFDV